VHQQKVPCDSAFEAVWVLSMVELTQPSSEELRFGSVDEELVRVVDNLLRLAPDDFARFLLELSSLSREELLARFNSHE
jgi:hypothetical protein